jgi:capsule polysaccharide modification protein KpsS
MLVKEHPMAVGYRPTRFYKEINSIPNVTVLGPMEDLSRILKDAKMLITISGTSAFEAILKKIPVIHFGDLPFEILSDTMIKKLNSFNDVSHSYNMLLTNYNYDESEVIRYIETCVRNSVPLDFYSLFLKKSQLNISKKSIESEQQKQFYILEKYIISKLD